ncbi:MAG: transglycosylase domain-containing protein [Bacteroidia bacterium]|nr:transglycosylase domain-containing protein [Bacteroidia bacterium]
MNESKQYKYLKWISYVLWAILLLTFVLVTRFLVTTANGDLPSFADLENPSYDEASIIYDTNGESFGKYYVENRELITYEQLSPHVLNSLLATEDIRFFKHSGIDIKALLRVAFKTVLLRQESSGGGSTISQQLAKLLYKRSSFKNMSKFQRAFALVQTKVKEWITAVRLEKSYTKEEIIAMYLNKFEFINGAHGIQAAAQTYFGVNQKNLSVPQAALLVGMLKNPSLYNPLRFPENATVRRNVVLNQLEKYFEVENSAELDSVRQQTVDMTKFNRAAHDVGPAPYFRSELTKWLKNLFDSENIKKGDGSDYNIYTDGLKIYTTIDLRYQVHAEAAVAEHMKWLQDRYWQVWRNRNPWTYDADAEQRKIRKLTLDRKLKESERYLQLHDRFLGPIKLEAQKNYNDIPLNENVIKVLIDIYNKKISWNHAISYDMLPEGLEDDYKNLLKGKTVFKTIKSQYEALQKEFKVVFNTKIPMQVFDYSEAGFKEVEMSPLDSVKYHNQHLQTSLLAVHPRTGHIKAWVGGSGFNYFKYDHVNSKRQVGSTIKPFVYATAISLMGISPCQTYEDIQYTIAPGSDNFLVDKEWSPSNANGEFTGNFYNLYQGLFYSKNSITVRLVKEMGNVDVIRELLDNVGISKTAELPDGRYVIPRVPSICLGAIDLSLKEMAGAYTTFANDGIYTEPIFISRIEDKSGKIIYTGLPKSRRAINSLYNGVMVDMLKNNVHGGYGLGLESQAGGKTGTTNDYADGWFMSITPDLVTGVWSGGDDKWIRFLSLDDGQGFVMARPIVQKFLKAVENDTLINFNKEAEFPSPPKGFLEFIDCDKFKQMSVEEEQNLSKLNQREDEFSEEFSDELIEFEDEFGDEIKVDTTKAEIKKDTIDQNR